MHLAVARRGAWIEYDGIGGWGEDADYIANIHRVLDAGFGDRLLLSHDRGWFDPAQPGGGTPKPYTYLIEVFLPKLRDSGVDEATIAMLTRRQSLPRLRPVSRSRPVWRWYMVGPQSGILVSRFPSSHPPQR